MDGEIEKKRGMKYMFAGTYPQVLAVLSCTISAVGDGMQYAWSAPIIPILEGKDSPIRMTQNELDWLENIYLLGGIFGVPCTIFLVQKIGRKYSIIVTGMFNLSSWLIIAIANKPLWLLIARFITGVAGDVAFVATPMYIAEIADQKIRGFLATLIYTMMLVGTLLMYIIGPYVSIFTSSCIGAIFLVIQLVTFPFFPESPYYYLSKGKYNQAKRSLQRLRVEPNIDKEIGEMIEAIERQKTERGRPQDLLLDRGSRKALVVMIVLNAAQQLSGICVIVMNLHLILTATGSIYISTNHAAIIFSALMMIAAFIAGLVCDRFGRKFLLIVSTLLSGILLLIIAVFLHMKHLGYGISTLSWIPVCCIFLYALVFKVGLGIIPIVLTAELFPAKLKALGMSAADLTLLIWAFISVYLFLFCSRNFGIFVPFYIFSVCSFTSLIFSVFYVPETRGKTLEEIQIMLKKSGKNINNKGDARPEGVSFLS